MRQEVDVKSSASSAASSAGRLVPAVTLAAGKRDLVIGAPLTNVAGFLGCDAMAREALDFSCLGAYITPPRSLQPRSAARGPRLLTFPGGFLLHTGHPNPGLRFAIEHERRLWASMPCPVIMHLLLRSTAEASEMVRRVESLEEVAGLELGLGEVDAAQAGQLVAACSGELPLIAQLPLGTPTSVYAAAIEAGAHAVSIGAPRGVLPSPGGGAVRGRLYGPAVFPLALQVVDILKRRLGAPILAAGGVYRAGEAEEMLLAGASAVQLDGVLWTAPERVLRGSQPRP